MTPPPSSSANVSPANLAGSREARLLECLQCGRPTRHVRGRVTYGARGALLVQWWQCTVCGEGETIA